MTHFFSSLFLPAGRLGLGVAVVLSLHLRAGAQTNEHLILADVEGFTDDEVYSVGNLTTVTDGAATWLPATAGSGQIVNLGSGNSFGKVLRRTQTGSDNADVLSFAPVSNGTLTIQFDARASVTGSRTLDVFLYPNAGGETCLLGWGTVSNQLCYYNGTSWMPALALDANWHRIEMINYLSGSKFGSWDLKVDGSVVATNLPWRNQHPMGTAYGRLRFGGIRGTAGTFGDVDNVVITAEVPVLPPDVLVLTNPAAGGGTFTFAFQAKTNAEYLIESQRTGDADWETLTIIPGTGTEARYTNQPATQSAEFFRVKRLPPPGYADGYRGIWFTLGQSSEYGDKYSGGLGTYTANHLPIAIYSATANKTFFVYGGAIKDRRHLLIMASYYDHATGQVPRPTLVLDKQNVNDPHDNAALALDDAGHLWVFVSGRGNSRPGWKFRSQKPYSVAEFEFIRQDTMTYPQPRHIPGFGFFNLFTKYTAGRELYWETSTNGVDWSAHQKLAGIGGHYQVSNVRSNNLIGTFFNRHPGGNVDKRTDLYYLQTTNFGVAWTTAAGVPVSVPVTTTNNPARVIDYAGQGKLMYTLDLDFDANGHPVLRYLVSNNYQPGPAGNPREWKITRWTGTQWITSTVTTSTHNYDFGSLYLQADRWLIIGPTEPGPQFHGTGGEIALWSSVNQGLTWTKDRQITTNSIYNHTYARRPLHAKDPFFAFWADGDPDQFSPSRLYFGDSTGTNVWQLPYDMSDGFAKPLRIAY